MSHKKFAGEAIVIAGPTASGKTSRALELAKQKNGAIISADSRMVYERLDIGTGKPTWEYRTLEQTPWIEPRRTTSGVTSSARGGTSPEERLFKHHFGSDEFRPWRNLSRSEAFSPIYTIQGIDHYLLDVVQPETRFTLTDWLTCARVALRAIKRAGQHPIVIGGTGLYLKALIEGYQPPPTDPAVRATIETLETAQILEKLRAIDPETAEREAPNRRRLIRALEIVKLTGQPASAHQNRQPMLAEIIKISLPRTELFARIDQRITERLGAGMVEEVKRLLQEGVSSDWLRSLGLEYRIITEWLEEDTQKESELINRLQKDIHAYARRQETFLRTQLRP